jgi:tRNA-2-methylthio-N6-dimethylallyladenosine synthase
VRHEIFYIETYGCQMNEHDSEKMAALLRREGLVPVPSAEKADVVLINTCSIRAKAEHKLYSALGKLKPLKAKNPRMVTIAAGCVAQQEKGNLLKRVQHLDAVLGTHCISRLPAIIEKVREERQRIDATELVGDVESLHMPAPCAGPSPVWSYVTVMQGCSNFCSYCVVPYTRGREQSRPMGEIVNEVKELLAKGIKEVTLLGQNVNAYGNDLGNGSSFVELLEKLDNLTGLARVRFTTSHPRDFSQALARAMAGLKSVCEHIHLPLQSGSDRVLKGMRRGYTTSQYLETIVSLREAVPSVAVTADIIVGFPGESDEDFEQTFSALKEIRFDQIFSFKYSPRPGTAACDLPNQVPESVKADRLDRVHDLQDSITEEYHRAMEGCTEEVLIEGIRESSGQPFGRTRTNKIVNLEPNSLIQVGDLTWVRISAGLKHSLLGRAIP